jgi:hypothetical protein
MLGAAAPHRRKNLGGLRKMKLYQFTLRQLTGFVVTASLIFAWLRIGSPGFIVCLFVAMASAIGARRTLRSVPWVGLLGGILGAFLCLLVWMRILAPLRRIFTVMDALAISVAFAIPLGVLSLLVLWFVGSGRVDRESSMTAK